MVFNRISKPTGYPAIEQARYRITSESNLQSAIMKNNSTHCMNTRSSSVAKTVRDLISINPRFRRSVQIELDLNDRTSTESYVATDFVVNCLKRISVAFEQRSSL